MASCKWITLNNSYKIPSIGLGTYSGQDLAEVVGKSIDIGYQLIDTAFIYENEDQIGVGLKKAFTEKKVNREDLFIVSKLWNTEHRPEKVIPAIKKTLNDLQLDYLDLYLMHWPFAMVSGENKYEIFNNKEDNVPFEQTWLAMEECVKQGLTKSIGLSNFNSQQIERILKIATIKPVINQVECNPYLNQEKLRNFCQERDIVVMAYSPFYAPNRLGSVSHGLNLFEEPVITEIAQKHKKKPNQVILRYLIQCGVIPIPKTDKSDRLFSNLDVFDFELSNEDMEKMKLLNKNLRCTDFKATEKFDEYPFNIEF